MKTYKIPIVWQSYKKYEVEAEDLQSAIELALKQFLAEPDELYLEDDPVYGLFDYLNSEISIRIKKLDDTLCDKEQVFNSFWHEVFHAFNYLYNNEMNESLAQVFANFMREFQSTVKY